MRVTDTGPGKCVIMTSGAASSATAYSATACGVTPHAQNTGNSPGLTSTGSPWSGRSRSAMPSASGSPVGICDTRTVVVTASGTRCAGIGRLDQGKRLRVAPAEAQEVEGVGVGQYHQVGLHVLSADARRGTIPFPRPAGFPETFGTGYPQAGGQNITSRPLGSLQENSSSIRHFRRGVRSLACGAEGD